MSCKRLSRFRTSRTRFQKWMVKAEVTSKTRRSGNSTALCKVAATPEAPKSSATGVSEIKPSLCARKMEPRRAAGAYNSNIPHLPGILVLLSTSSAPVLANLEYPKFLLPMASLYPVVSPLYTITSSNATTNHPSGFGNKPGSCAIAVAVFLVFPPPPVNLRVSFLASCNLQTPGSPWAPEAPSFDGTNGPHRACVGNIGLAYACGENLTWGLTWQGRRTILEIDTQWTVPIIIGMFWVCNSDFLQKIRMRCGHSWSKVTGGTMMALEDHICEVTEELFLSSGWTHNVRSRELRFKSLECPTSMILHPACLLALL